MPNLPEEASHIYALMSEVEEQYSEDAATLSRLLEETERFVRAYPDSLDAHYLHGLALYSLWCHHSRDSRYVREPLDEMLHILQIEPSAQFALWFAIVFSEHLGDDGAVVAYFARLNRKAFIDEHKDWWYLLAWEYALCSHLRLGRRSVFEEGLRCLVQEFVKVADDVEALLARPYRLVALYQDLRAGSGGPDSNVGQRELVALLEEQLALLVPGGWVKAEELGDTPPLSVCK